MMLYRTEQLAFYGAFFSYGLSTLLYWLSFLPGKQRLNKPAVLFTLLGFIGNTAAIVFRGIITQRPPLANGYEFLLAFSWGMVAVYLFMAFRYKLKTLGAFVLPAAFGLLLFILLAMAPEQRQGGGIMPALKSNWLTFHVFTAVLAYGAFAVAAGLAVTYLLKAKRTEQEIKGSWLARLPALEILDELIYKIICFAFPMLTLCIITGAIWANRAWGTYWSWDPKEVWALITWIIYAGYLHARLMGSWRGERTAWLAVIGFAAVIFAFFGVNYFLPGLHSYA